MIPPLFMVFHRLMRSAWSIGSVAMRLVMAALGLDLLLHPAGVAGFDLVAAGAVPPGAGPKSLSPHPNPRAAPRLPGGSSGISISAPCSTG